MKWARLGVAGAVVLFLLAVGGTSRVVLAAPASPFVGDWKAIHADPSIPDARLHISGHLGPFGAVLMDAQDYLACGGGPAVAAGRGVLLDSHHLRVDFLFWCLRGGTLVRRPVLFTLSPDPLRPFEMVDDSGHFWSKPH